MISGFEMVKVFTNFEGPQIGARGGRTACRRTACRTGLCGGRPSARDGSLLSLSEEINELDASKEMVGITSMGEVDEEIAGNVDFASRPTGAQRRNLEEQFQRSVRGNGKPSGSER